MIDDLKNLTERVSSDDAKDLLALGKIGIEKESLRISQQAISKRKHQQSIGSPLCHKYITTDFSEALLELITPPIVNKSDGLKFLENIQSFEHVSHFLKY